MQCVHPDLQELIKDCLHVLPKDRPSAQQLLKYRLFDSRFGSVPAVFKFPISFLPRDLQRIHLLISKRPLTEVFQLWQLVGGDAEVELRKAGILRNKPAIFSLPWYF